MGELFDAYESLNRTLKLGLKPEQLLRAEGAFKNQMAQVSNPAALRRGGHKGLIENYEMKITVAKRRRSVQMDKLPAMARRSTRKLKLNRIKWLETTKGKL